MAPSESRRIGHEGDRLSLRCELVAARQSWDEVDAAVAETRAVGKAYGMKALQAHADRLEGRASIAAADLKGGRALLSAARDRFSGLGDHWEAARTTLDLAGAGGDADLAAAAELFTRIGAVAEAATAQRLLSAAKP